MAHRPFSRRSLVIAAVLTGGLSLVAVAATEVFTSAAGVRPHALDQTYPTDYPIPLPGLAAHVPGQAGINGIIRGGITARQQINVYNPNAPRTDLTLSLWVKATESRRALLARNNCAGEPGQEIGPCLPALTIEPGLAGGRGGVNLRVATGGDFATKGSFPVTDGRWHHVALVWVDAVRCMSVFVDGLLDGRACGVDFGYPSTLNIGGGPSLAGQPGVLLDDVRAYRRALGADELQRLRNMADSGLVRVFPPTAVDPASTTATTLSIGGVRTGTGLKMLNLNPGKTSWSPDWTEVNELGGLSRGVTLSGWVDVKEKGAVSDNFLRVEDPRTNRLALHFGVQDGRLSATFPASGGFDTDTVTQAVADRRVLGRHFVAVAYGEGRARLYIDGLLVADKQAALSSVNLYADTQSTFSMGGGTGIEVGWIAVHDRVLSAEQLEAVRREGPALWVGGARSLSPGVGFVEELTYARRVDGSTGYVTTFHPATARFDPDLSLQSILLGRIEGAPRALAIDDGGGVLSRPSFSLFTRANVTLESGKPAVFSLLSRRPTASTDGEVFSAHLDCTAPGAGASCKLRANGYVSPPRTGVACVTTSGPNQQASLTCPAGQVVSSIQEAYANGAQGTCDGGALAGSEYIGSTSRLYREPLRVRCVGRNSCRVDDLAGAVPAGQPARLAVRASCVAAPERNKCLTSNDLFTFNADCGAGKVWTRIDGYLWGDAGAAATTCDDPQLAEQRIDGTSVAAEKCLGKQSCQLGLSPTGNAVTTPQVSVLGLCEPAPAAEQAVCAESTPATEVSSGTLTLACDPGLLIADVTQAFFGDPGGTCAAGFTAGTCNAATALARAKARCVGLAQCIVSNPGAEFPETTCGKRFVVKAVCRPPPGPKAVCSNVNDGQSTTLACPDGFVVGSIDAAAYGAATGACTSGTPLVPNASCDAKDVRTKVEQRCLGKASCTFVAPDVEFGDPCGGAAKNFTIRATCRQSPAARAPLCLDTPNVPSALVCPAGEIIQAIEYAEYSNMPSGTCREPVPGSCITPAQRQNQIDNARTLCVGRPSCVLPRPSELAPLGSGWFPSWCDYYPDSDMRFLVRARCGALSPRSWVSQPFPAPTGDVPAAIALSWDGVQPRLAVDGAPRDFTPDNTSPFLSAPLPGSTQRLRTYFGPERVQSGPTAPARVPTTVRELRLYSRALSTPELTALGRSCASLACGEVDRLCAGRNQIGLEAATSQCTACTPAGWAPATAPNAPEADECLPDFGFMDACDHDTQCASKCDDGRCDAASAAVAAPLCEKLGRSLLRSRCGPCLPDYVASTDPADTRCLWRPTKETGEVCTADAQCLAGVCAKAAWPTFTARPLGPNNAPQAPTYADRYLCAPADCNECNALNTGCYEAGYTPHPNDYLKLFSPEGTARGRAKDCHGCQSGYTAGYRLMSPDACGKIQRFAVTYGARFNQQVSSYTWAEGYLWNRPTLARLRDLIVGIPVPWRDVTSEDIAKLAAAGVGEMYLGWAAMPEGPEKIAREQAFRGGAVPGSCLVQGSAFDNPAENPVVCKPVQSPEGAICPPPSVEIVAPYTEHSFCSTGYCGPEGTCAFQKNRDSETAAENRADDTSKTPPESKNMGEFGGAAQNVSTVDVGKDGEEDTRAKCIALPTRTEMRIREGQQSTLVGGATADMFLVQINGKKEPGGEFKTTSAITIMGLPVGYDPQPLAGCDMTANGGQGKCSHSADDWANLSAPAMNICVPIPEAMEEPPFTIKKTFIVGPGIPILLSIGPVLDACLGVQVAREPEGMSAFVGIKGAFGVGIDIRGGIGAEIAGGLAEFFVGIRAEVILAALSPVYKRIIEITEIKNKPSLQPGQKGTPVGDTTFKIEKKNGFELELDILALGVSLLVEFTVGIFGWEIERSLAEVVGFRQVLAEAEDEPETDYLVPCFGRK